ncbi:interleukin-10 receptor subunit beta [Corythoichthys intestinalis]|uniref:interleukin-10 receptor subunit beta n=1 Tax=Corythoichthys intestinalis TaxID=161448 RepID=UPI0025A61FCC|nr:interleukin-10 receptor subunit beta [Corythoichthys intestinalis]
MFQHLFFFLLLYRFVWLHASNVRQELPPPQNVELITLNTNYTLKWDWNETASKSAVVSYTVQYIAQFWLDHMKEDKWSTVCDKKPSKSCDLTQCGMHYMGKYMIRVCANDNFSHSDWVKKEFCPQKHAAVGPPSEIKLFPGGNNIEVNISHPLPHKKLGFNIVYWEYGVDKKDLQPQISETKTGERVILQGLKSWTRYCVRIQSYYEPYKKRSKFSLPYCIQTQGTIPWWQTFVFFLGSFVIGCAVFLLFLYILFVCYKIFKATFCPLIQFAPFFQKYHLESLGSDIPHLLSMGSEAELFCDVTICPKPMECHSPLSNAPSISPSGVHQDSGSSGLDSHKDKRRSNDSGVYSRESSNCQHLNSSKSSSGLTLDLDPVKMHHVTPAHKCQCRITDEVL